MSIVENFIQFAEVIFLIYAFIKLFSKYIDEDGGVLKDCIDFMTGGESKVSNLVYPKSTDDESNGSSQENTQVISGLQVPDQFAWLEDTKSPRTRRWLSEQRQCTSKYMKSIRVLKDTIAEKIQLSNGYERIDTPFHLGNRYFFYKKIDWSDLQYALFVTYDLSTEAKLVFNSNALRIDATGFRDDSLPVSPSPSQASGNSAPSSSIKGDEKQPPPPLQQQLAVLAAWISEDGHKIAFGFTSSFSSSRLSIGVKNIRFGEKFLPDIITGCSAATTSVTWLDSKVGFFYTAQEVLPFNEEEEEDRAATGAGAEEETSETVGASASIEAAKGGTAKGRAKHASVISDHGADIKRRQVPRFSSKVFFHYLGSPQKSDLLVFETITMFDAVTINTRLSSDSHYMILDIFKSKRDISASSLHRNIVSEHSSHESVGNKLYYFDLSKFDGKALSTLGSCIKLIDTFAYRFDYISNIEEDFWFRTNYQAPNFRVVRITLPDFSSAATFQKLRDVVAAKGEGGNGTSMQEGGGSGCGGGGGSSSRDGARAGAGHRRTGRGKKRATAEEIAHTLLMCWKDCVNWIPERLDGDYLESATIAAHTVMVLKYLKNASHEVLLYDLTQTLGDDSRIPVADLPHPPYGTISGPNAGFFSSEIFYHYSDLSDPGSIYRAIIDRDPFSGSIEISFDQINSISIPHIDKHSFETTEEFCKSASSTDQIPLLIFGDTQAFEDRSRPKPCIICPYGGFGVPMTPRFSLPLLIYARYFNALIVLANLHGSGLYGRPFAEGGWKDRKTAAADDLASVVRHLISQGYTTHPQLGIYCGHATGVVVGACVAQKPSMFAAVVVQDGLFDLMKYQELNPPVAGEEAAADVAEAKKKTHEVVKGTAGMWADSLWHDEFGCARDSPEECRRLLALSPLHSLRAMEATATFSYPAVMLTVGSCSPQSNAVSCQHSFKFIAELQRTFGGSKHMFKPLLLDVSVGGDEEEEEEDKGIAAAGTGLEGSNGCSHRDRTVVVYEDVPMEQIVSILAFIAQNTTAECRY